MSRISPAGLIFHVAMLPLGAAALIMGAMGTARDGEMEWMFGLLFVAGVAIVAGGIHGLVTWPRKARLQEAITRAMVAEARAPSTDRRMMSVLATWTYTEDEWRDYAAAEMRFRIREALGMGATVVALGTPLLGVFDGEWGVAFGISLAVGGFIALWRGGMGWAAWRRNRAATTGGVIVGPDAILINGRYEAVHDGSILFGGARVLDRAEPAILEINLVVPGKYRHVREKLRIPIPTGHEEEARAVAEALRQAHSLAAPATPRGALPGA